jgi:hypothetical protein
MQMDPHFFVVALTCLVLGTVAECRRRDCLDGIPTARENCRGIGVRRLSRTYPFCGCGDGLYVAPDGSVGATFYPAAVLRHRIFREREIRGVRTTGPALECAVSEEKRFAYFEIG